MEFSLETMTVHTQSLKKTYVKKLKVASEAKQKMKHHGANSHPQNSEKIQIAGMTLNTEDGVKTVYNFENVFIQL